MPPDRFELPTPGLQDQCSTTELKRLLLHSDIAFFTIKKYVPIKFALRPTVVTPEVHGWQKLCVMWQELLLFEHEISVFSREWYR